MKRVKNNRLKVGVLYLAYTSETSESYQSYCIFKRPKRMNENNYIDSDNIYTGLITYNLRGYPTIGTINLEGWKDDSDGSNGTSLDDDVVVFELTEEEVMNHIILESI